MNSVEVVMAPELIGALVTLIGIVVAAWVAVHQITKQTRMGLKVELYRETLGVGEAQGDAARELSTQLTVLDTEIAIWFHGGPAENPILPTTSWSGLNDLHYRAGSEGAELITLIEKWQIVDGRLEVFRYAFNSAAFDIRQAWDSLERLLRVVIPVFPGTPAPERPPNEHLQAVRVAIAQYILQMSKLEGWVADFQLEMQRILLSDLFDEKHLQHREPINPELFVIRLDRYRELKDHFLNGTPWGRDAKAINERVRALTEQEASAVPRNLP